MLLQIDKAKVKLSLQTQVYRVIVSMNNYNNSDKVYHFPHYKEFDTALYAKGGSTIFSTLKFEPSVFSEGFHIEDNNYYMIYPLPKEFYFKANYLLVSTVHRANDIYVVSIYCHHICLQINQH